MPGLISNYKNSFLYFLCNILNINFVNKQRARTWIAYVNTYALIDKSTFLRYLLFKVLYLTYEKTLLKIKKWQIHYKNVLKFWKLFIFFKNFKSIFHMPDCLFIITPLNSWAHIHEYAKCQSLPVVGLFDCLNHGLTYPIPSNDDSIALSLFYVSLFCNAYLIEKYYIFNF
jgi:hypothetical protein